MRGLEKETRFPAWITVSLGGKREARERSWNSNVQGTAQSPGNVQNSELYRARRAGNAGGREIWREGKTEKVLKWRKWRTALKCGGVLGRPENNTVDGMPKNSNIEE